jgi:uncharacterized protein YbjT (DUF2867 family)
MTKTNGDNGIYLVSGATGNVGSAVAARLLPNGRRTRVFTRDASKVARLANSGAEVAIGDFQQPETFARALAGVDAVFLMNQSPDPAAFARLVSTIAESGHPRIVFLSSLAASQPDLQIGRLHKQKEEAIRESGTPAKFLRPGGFMSNAYQWIGGIKADGIVYNAMGEAKFPPIAPEDIGEVAVAALGEPERFDEILELTGGELLSVPEQVKILASVLDQPIRCVDVPVQTAVENMIRAGVPPQLAAGVGQSYEAVRNGWAVAMTDTVQKVTGKKPMSFEAWCRIHASRFEAAVKSQMVGRA